MVISWSELLAEINEFFIKITREEIFKKEVDDFKSHVQKHLKLNKPEDWDYILASEDILEDSNSAISSFLRFGLSGPTKYNDLGEKYLRLYGLLNATYLQQQAILNLYRYFQCPDPKDIIKEIEELEVREIRHKLGAHSADYLAKNKKEIHAFVPVQILLEDFKCEYLNHITNDVHKVDLKLVIESHLKLMCNIYYKITVKSIKTIFKNNSNKAQELIEQISPFKEMINGAALMKKGNSDEYIIVNFI